MKSVVVLAGLVAVACAKPVGQAAPKEPPVADALASAVSPVHTQPTKTPEKALEQKPAVAVLPWACPAFFESSVMTGLRGVWSSCPVAPPMESPAGLCTEAPCLRPCEYLRNARVWQRYAYVDGRLAGSWDLGGSGEVYATSRMLYDAEGRLVSEIGENHYVDLKYEGGRAVNVVHQEEVTDGELTFEYDSQGPSRSAHTEGLRKQSARDDGFRLGAGSTGLGDIGRNVGIRLGVVSVRSGRRTQHHESRV